MAEEFEFEQEDFTVDLNTENGQNSTITSKRLVGKLDSIIVQCSNTVNLIINSELGYNILNKSVKGTMYIAPRAKSQEAQDNLMGFSLHSKFNLNEKLDIIISGQNNTDIKLIFRFS